MAKNTEVRVGIVGTGYIAKGLTELLKRDSRIEVSKVLTRRRLSTVIDGSISTQQATNHPDELIRNSDIVFISTGDPIYGTEVAVQALAENRPVVTMDAELQVTTGSYLAKLGYLTEAQGDQPGSLAALNEEVVAMGFRPLVYGNIKGFLNPNPTKLDMEYWATRQGISLEQVTAFTDGTKLQIEQALVANGLGATIAKNGLIGPKTDDLKTGAFELADAAKRFSIPISDYVLPKHGNPGVFIVAEHDEDFIGYLRYYKVLGQNEQYSLLERPYHLCNLEVPITIRRIIDGGKVLINNSINPGVSVAAIAKRRINKGEVLDRAIGSFDVRGEAILIDSDPDHVPIGLLRNAIVEQDLEPGQRIYLSDVNIPESLAFKAWNEIVKSRY